MGKVRGDGEGEGGEGYGVVGEWDWWGRRSGGGGEVVGVGEVVGEA